MSADDGHNGLGLTHVREMVAKMGGFAVIKSAVGEGTMVEIYLPRLKSSHSSQALPVQRPETFSPAEEVLLLVEDDDLGRQAQTRILKALGFTQIVIATNGVEALELFHQRGDITCVMTDVRMPEMGGEELADQLLAENPKLPVLFFSGNRDHRSVRHPSTTWLEKPAKGETVYDTIAKLVMRVRKPISE